MPQRTESITFDGMESLDSAIQCLLDRSAWFAVVPLPDDQWELSFKLGEGHRKAIEKLAPIPAASSNVFQYDEQTRLITWGKIEFDANDLADLFTDAGFSCWATKGLVIDGPECESNSVLYLGDSTSRAQVLNNYDGRKLIAFLNSNSPTVIDAIVRKSWVNG